MLSFDLKVKLANIQDEYSKVAPVTARCEHFLGLLEHHSEVTVLETLLQEFTTYNYLPSIKAMIEECANVANQNHNKYLVEKTINILDRANDPITYGAIKKLQGIAAQGETEITESLRGFSDYDFISPIASLRQMVSYHNNGAKTTADISVSSNIYSSVINLDEGKLLFNLDNNFYIYNPNTKEICENNTTLSSAFVERVKFLKQCTVNENTVLFYFKGKEYKIDINEDKFYIAGKEMTKDPVKLFESIDWCLGMGNTHIAHQVYDLYENRNDIVHLDFVTRLQNKYDNKHITYNLMKLEENFYVNRVNVINGDNSFQKVENLNECVTLIKSEINYDISENVKDFKDKKDVMISESKDLKNGILEQLAEINKTIQEYTALPTSAENEATIKFLQEELETKTQELKHIQSKLNQTLVESMEDEGYSKATVESNYQGLKKGQEIYVFSKDVTKKGNSDIVKCKTQNGTNCEIPKGMLNVSLK